MRPIVHCLVLIILIFLALRGENKGSDIASLASDKIKQEQDKLEMLVFLHPSTVVLEVGQLKLTRKDLSEYLQSKMSRGGGQIANRNIKKDNEELEAYFRQIAKRGLFLLESRALKLTITPDERKVYEDELRASLQNNPQGISLQDFLKTFKSKSSTLLEISLDDAFILQKLAKQREKTLKVSDQELEQFKNALSLANGIIQHNNDKKRENLEAALKDPSINTDKGFARLAQELSEGTEARNGGELDYDFLRSELADINKVKDFSYNPGETTPIFETPTCYRIMRILRAVPMANDEKEFRLRCAQILIGKNLLNDLNDIRAITDKYLTLKKIRDLDVYASELSKKFKVKSNLFPEGLF